MKFIPGIQLNSTDNKLNIFSFIFLLLADLFILSLLFFGLSEQVDQFTSEYDYFPYRYRNMLINQTWVENNIIEEVSDTVLEEVRYTGDRVSKEMHPACMQIRECFDGIIRNRALMERIKAGDRLRKQYDNLGYDASRRPEKSALSLRIRELEKELRGRPEISKTVSLIFKLQKADYTDDLKRFNRIFALKRTVFDFIFILPFLMLLILWNRRALKKEKSLSVVISSHLILVAVIPLGFELVRLIIEVIPRVILKTIYDFLIRLNLISFWYYAVLLISIALIVFIVWILQTKIFTKKRTQIRKYEKGQCMNCSSGIDYEKEYCPVCGTQVLVKCAACGRLTVANMDFCRMCGKGISG